LHSPRRRSSIKLVADSLTSRAWLSVGLVAAVAAMAGVTGILSEQTALQRREATRVTPIIFVIELVVPLELAITIGGESWDDSPLSLCSITVGIGVLIVSVVVLMQTPAVSGLLAVGQQDEGASGPARPSQARTPAFG